jgi:hypothetical protein
MLAGCIDCQYSGAGTQVHNNLARFYIRFDRFSIGFEPVSDRLAFFRAHTGLRIQTHSIHHFSAFRNVLLLLRTLFKLNRTIPAKFDMAISIDLL